MNHVEPAGCKVRLIPCKRDLKCSSINFHDGEFTPVFRILENSFSEGDRMALIQDKRGMG